MPTETTSPGNSTTRQSVRDVLQTDKDAVVHQVLAEKQRRSPRFGLNRDRLLGLLGTGVVLDSDALDGLNHSIVAREAFASGRARTMQEVCLRLMGKKLLVALAMEGKFASESLQAIDGDDDMLTAMARELMENKGIGKRRIR
jgi:hypothetical protein